MVGTTSLLAAASGSVTESTRNPDPDPNCLTSVLASILATLPPAVSAVREGRKPMPLLAGSLWEIRELGNLREISVSSRLAHRTSARAERVRSGRLPLVSPPPLSPPPLLPSQLSLYQLPKCQPSLSQLLRPPRSAAASARKAEEDEGEDEGEEEGGAKEDAAVEAAEEGAPVVGEGEGGGAGALGNVYDWMECGGSVKGVSSPSVLSCRLMSASQWASQ